MIDPRDFIEPKKVVMEGVVAIENKLDDLIRQSVELDMLKIESQNAPLIEQFQAMIAEIQEQNRILAEQIKLQKEEIERQKQEIERSRKSERIAKIRSWISIVIAIFSLVATIVIGIVKLM